MAEFIRFYRQHDGFELCRTFNSLFDAECPQLEFKPADCIVEFTKRYNSDGDRDFTITYNKSRTIYRGGDPWFAFAEINMGPACLTTFLEGENAGKIFYVTPEPEFNILRPIAPSFSAVLDRIGKDVAAFLRLR